MRTLLASPSQGGGGLRRRLPDPRPRLLKENHADDVAAELLGVSGTEAVRKSITELGASGDACAQVITLALVLGVLEARFPERRVAQRRGGLGQLRQGQRLPAVPGDQLLPARRDRGGHRGREDR